MKKKEDQRVRITKLMIKNAFLSLLKAKNLQNITVSELCEKAEINRGTFYLYYKDIYDLRDVLVNAFIDDFKKKLLPIFLFNKNHLTDLEFIEEILKTLYKNKDLTEAFFANQIDKDFVNEILNTGEKIVLKTYSKFFKDKDEKQFKLFYKYSSSGSLALIIEWIKSNFSMPIDEFAIELQKLLNASITYFDLN